MSRGQPGPSTPRVTGVFALSAWQVFATVAAAYGSLSLVAFTLFDAARSAALFPAAGVSLTALVLSPLRRWPWVLAAVGATEFGVDLFHGLGVGASLGFTVANVVEPLVGAVLLRRLLGRVDLARRVDLSRRADLVAFLSCCVVAGPAVGAAVGGTTIALVSDRAWATAFSSFWAGDAVGVLVVAGGALAWVSAGPRDRQGLTAALSWALLTAAVTVLAFWPRDTPLAYLPIPLLFWSAFRHGVAVVATSGFAMAVSANIVTTSQRGPWASLAVTPQLEIASLQVFLAISVLGAWSLAVEIADRDRARRLATEESIARQRSQALQTVTAGLATAATTASIADLVVRQGIALIADHGVVAVVAPDRTHVLTWASDGFPTEVADGYRRLSMRAVTPITDVVRSGAPVTQQTLLALTERYPSAAETYHVTGTRSSLCVPAQVDGVTVAALAFGFEREQAVDSEVLAFAHHLAEVTARALDRARLYEREFEAAHQLQRALLPVIDPQPVGVRAWAHYRPADSGHEVGGDWYDVFALPGGRIGLTVGDVVGHDLGASTAMGRLQSLVRFVAETAAGPAQVLEQLDRACAHIPDSALTTIGYGEYDPVSGVLRYACAGHLPPLLVTGGVARFLEGGRSLPLGVNREPRPEGSVTPAAGATLVWYSDGLVERRSTTIAHGLDRLRRLAATLPAGQEQTWCDTLIAGLAGDVLMHDDVVVLVARFEPAPSGGSASPR